MDSLLHDLKLAARRLISRPGFTIAAAAALALGIGSTTAIYTVVQAVVLRPLPYQNAHELLMVWEQQPSVSNASISAPDLRDWKAQAKTVAIAGYTSEGWNLTGRERAERLVGLGTDDAFFQVLRVPAILGRTYTEGSRREVVLADTLWKRTFGGDATIVGKTITLNGHPHTVVGVIEKRRAFPSYADLWSTMAPGQDVPWILGMTANDVSQRGSHYLRAIARLQNGATLQTAQAELESIGARLEATWPDNKGHRAKLEDMQRVVVGPAAPIWVLFGGVLLVLLIACANVAGLQLAQAAARQREIATRLALGASRWQLMRQLLAESVLLSLLGGALGTLLSFWGVDALIALAGRGLPRAQEVKIDGQVLAFTTGISLLVGILGGLAPALLASRGGNLGALKDGSPAGFGRARLRSALIVAEVALALVLLAGAGLLARSFFTLRNVDPGFQTENVLTARLARPGATKEASIAFYEELLRRVSAIPDVVAAGAVRALPMSGSNTNGDISIEGRGKPPENDRYIMEHQVIAGDYLQAMGIPLVKGRAFGPHDGRKGGRVAIVNRAAAERFWKGEDPIGKRFSFDNSGGPDSEGWIEVVGVAGDVRQFSLGTPPRPEAYYPHRYTAPLAMQLALKVKGDRNAVAAALRREVAALDPQQPVWSIQTLDELLGNTLSGQRASALLLGAFSALALLLAVVGIYAMMAYAVVQRTREIGVRMALGAEAGGVVRMVVAQGMKLAAIGLGIGIPAALLLSRVLDTQLYQTSPADPITHLATAAVLSAAALLACYVPARVAARVNPMTALRAE